MYNGNQKMEKAQMAIYTKIKVLQQQFCFYFIHLLWLLVVVTE